MYRSLSLLMISLLLFGCSTAQKEGLLPMHKDEYVFTTPERSFQLKEELSGIILRYQIAYFCDIDSIIYNSTAIVKLETGDTLTVYSPCLMTKFDRKDKVRIEPTDYDTSKHWTKRQILVQFEKESDNYPYYQCLSCRYANTIGTISLANKEQ